MINASARLARKITWAASKQSYLTARLLADPDLADDCLRAYAYFRWADDTIDIALPTQAERLAFIARQKDLIDRLYKKEAIQGLTPEEAMLSDLIAHDRGQKGGLQSFIRNFMAVIEFDAHRRDRPITERELAGYTTCLATAVMDGLLYFIGNGHPYPRTPDRILSVVGAHLTHMLRDSLEDLPAGFINIPSEAIDALSINLEHPEGGPFREWVKGQVDQAEACFQAGKKYIDSLDVFRAKLAGVWYCARFNCILAAIRRDGYILRQEYPERKCARTWLRMAGLALQVLIQHHRQQIGRIFEPVPAELDSVIEKLPRQSY